jgi:hypothetical protein
MRRCWDEWNVIVWGVTLTNSLPRLEAKPCRKYPTGSVDIDLSTIKGSILTLPFTRVFSAPAQLLFMNVHRPGRVHHFSRFLCLKSDIRLSDPRN